MKNGVKVAIVALLAVAVVATFALRGRKRAEDAPVSSPLSDGVLAAQGMKTQLSPPEAGHPAPRAVAQSPIAANGATEPAGKTVAAAAAPRLLELGSMRCQACLEMAKVLDALRASQGPKLQVDFIDVFDQPEAAERYQIQLIPTQILFDAAGKEIFRHQGYFSHDDILAKYRELGVRL
jgi:thioredoxin 1